MTVATRRFRTEDLPEVLAVLTASLGESPVLQRTPELFSWKHLLNPFGESLILLATVGGRIAGLRAVMRWELTHPDGHRVRCGRMVDTATHPEFQRMGIFRRLTMESLEEAEAEGIQLIFNTPNPQSGAGYLKMGWQQVGPIGVMVRPSRSILRRHSGLDQSRPEPADFFAHPNPAGGAFVADRSPRGLRTPRSAAYLHWRFVSHPTARYVEVQDGRGVALGRPNHRRDRRELVVSELLGKAPLSALRTLISGSTADYTVGWFSRGTPERAAATQAGMIPLPTVKALQLMARPLQDLPVDVSDLAAWDLSMGDLELL